MPRSVLIYQALILKGHLYSAGDLVRPCLYTVFVVILTLRQPLLRHWQFRSQKFATTPLPLSTWRYGAVHMPIHWALGHLGTTPATRVRIDTSWLCTSSPWTDAKSYRRVVISSAPIAI